MEKLTIEQKAKAYDEAYERAKKLKETCDSKAVVGWMEYIFPELKESEDERIKKEIIAYLKQKETCYSGPTAFNSWISWLKKQGETDSSIKWHDVSEKPEEDREILCDCVDSDGIKWHEVAFYHADSKTFWTGYKHIKNVTRWCYIDDLEKQSKQKETLCDKCRKAQPSHSCQDITELGRCYLEHEKQGEHKPAYKVEPKFHEGEWITIKE